MAWPVYTERFMQARGNGVTEDWQVPEGKRAIVKTILASTGDPATSWYVVRAHGYEVWRKTFQAAETSDSADTTLVLYERETLTVITGGSALEVTVCGFLFDDPIGAPSTSKPIEPDPPRVTPTTAGAAG